MTVYDNTAADGVDIGDTTSYLFQLLKTLSETIDIGDTALEDYVSVLTEILYIGDTLSSAGSTLNVIMVDDIVLYDSVLITFEQFLSEPFTIDDATVDTVGKLVALIETLQMTDVISTQHTATTIAAEVIGIYDSLLRFFDATLTETIEITDTIINSLLAAHILVEGMLIADTTITSLVIITTNTEIVNLNDSCSFGQYLQEILNEGFTFVTAFDFDGDTYKGWVMNSENFSTTTYDNYDFNSMCEFNGNYYGAQTDGIYLLEGTKDVSTYITSTLRTGKMDFETSNLKTVTQAYLGFSGDGSLVLKVISDDDLESWFELASSEDGLHTDKIGLAKGQVGRYWQFELVTQENTQLELDTLELFPIILKRKV